MQPESVSLSTLSGWYFYYFTGNLKQIQTPIFSKNIETKKTLKKCEVFVDFCHI